MLSAMRLSLGKALPDQRGELSSNWPRPHWKPWALRAYLLKRLRDCRLRQESRATQNPCRVETSTPQRAANRLAANRRDLWIHYRSNCLLSDSRPRNLA